METLKMVGAEGRMRLLWEDLVGQTAALGQRSRLYSSLGVHFVQMAQQMSMIGVVLFRGTIRENITIAAPSASDLDVLEVSRAVGLHDFITQHPAGYDLQVGERGDGLSGGQRQAVALARALLKGPNLLILDEPTSSMDTRSEEQVVANLERLLEDRTILLITHRLSLLKLVDRLIVLDKGRVVADGPREEVLARLLSGRVATA